MIILLRLGTPPEVVGRTEVKIIVSKVALPFEKNSILLSMVPPKNM